MKTPLFTKFKVASAVSPKTQDGKKSINAAENKIAKKLNNNENKQRKKSGCFCCRKRRIKCVGSKPTCTNCQKSKYVCVWPIGDQSLSHDTDFKLVKINEITNAEKKISNPKNVDRLNKLKKNKIEENLSSFVQSGSSSVRDVSQNQNEHQQVRKLTTTLGNEKEVESQNKKEVTIYTSENSEDSLISSNNTENSSSDLQDLLFREVLIEINSSVANGFLSRLSMSANQHKENGLLYDAFVNGFMIDVSPQLAHFKLQPGSAFIPTGLENSIVQNLFFSCGAAFLFASTKNEGMLQLCHDKLNYSVNEITSFLAKQELEGNESWLIIYLLLIYLKLRFVYDGQLIHTMSIIAATEAVKVWCARRNKVHERSKVVNLDDASMLEKVKINKILGFDNSINNFEGKDDEDDIFSAFDINNPIELIPYDFSLNYSATHLMFIHVINKCRLFLQDNQFKTSSSATVTSKLDSTSFERQIFSIFNSNNEFENENDDLKTNLSVDQLPIFPYERTMLESFIFNYTSMLFTCDRRLINQITSPFIIFEALKSYLSKPIYKCAVPWMNHPVVGAALPLFELQAKACWIAFFTPLSLKHQRLIKHIRKMANYYTRPILPLDVYCKEPETVQKKLMESCYAAEIIAKAVFIYTTKLLNPEIQTDDVMIQNTLQLACDAFKNISPQSHVHMVLSFSFAVLGSCAITKKHQEFFLHKLTKLREMFVAVAYQRLLNLYQSAWSSTEMGLNAVFDSDNLKTMVV